MLAQWMLVSRLQIARMLEAHSSAERPHARCVQPAGQNQKSKALRALSNCTSTHLLCIQRATSHAWGTLTGQAPHKRLVCQCPS